MSNGGAEARLTSAARKARLLLQSGLCGLCVFGLSVGIASAQTVPAAAPVAETKADPKKDVKPQDKATTDANASGDTTNVTVTAQKPLNRIDRQSYDNTKDPDSQTGTAADALNKVPGVNVDPSGNVTLRGKNAQILVNGKPSPMMSGDNRAAALQSMPSGSISSVEVINNPGAQFGTDSSGGGIINLVTKTNLPPGGFGIVMGQLTSTGGYSALMSGQYHTGKVTVQGSFGMRTDTRNGNSGSVRRSLDANGQTIRSTEGNSRSESSSDSIFTSGSFDYAFNPKDSLTAGLTYIRNASDSENTGNGVIYNTAGAATDIYTQSGIGGFNFENQSGNLTWSHTGKKIGETLKVDYRLSRNLNKAYSPSLSLYTLSTVPSNLAGRRSAFANRGNTNNSTFSVDYNRPIGNDQLTAGIQLAKDNSDSLNQSFGPVAASVTTLTVNPLFGNQFVYSQSVDAAYVTYQKPFGAHWTVLGGIRAESFELDALSVTTGLTNHAKYTTYNPSLFGTYVLSDKARVRLSYSRRLQRPGANDYNPATILTSETSVNVGQSNIQPQETDSYEAGYEHSFQGTSWSVRGYYTHETGMIISVSSYVADPLNLGNLVLRSARLNAGTRDTTGTEFNFSGKLTPKWSLNANANLSSVNFQTPNYVGDDTVIGLAGRVSLTYTTAKKNTVQMSYMVSPKILNGQGYRTDYSSLNLTYSHNLTPKTTLVLQATDVLRAGKTENFTSTTSAYGVNYRSNDAPVISVSVRRRFGGNFVPPKGGGPIIIGPGGPAAPTGAASPGGGGGSGGIRIGG